MRFFAWSQSFLGFNQWSDFWKDNFTWRLCMCVFVNAFSQWLTNIFIIQSETWSVVSNKSQQSFDTLQNQSISFYNISLCIGLMNFIENNCVPVLFIIFSSALFHVCMLWSIICVATFFSMSRNLNWVTIGVRIQIVKANRDWFFELLLFSVVSSACFFYCL